MSIQRNIILDRLNNICDYLEELDEKRDLLNIEKNGLIEKLREMKKREKEDSG